MPLTQSTQSSLQDSSDRDRTRARPLVVQLSHFEHARLRRLNITCLAIAATNHVRTHQDDRRFWRLFLLHFFPTFQRLAQYLIDGLAIFNGKMVRFQGLRSAIFDRFFIGRGTE